MKKFFLSFLSFLCLTVISLAFPINAAFAATSMTISDTHSEECPICGSQGTVVVRMEFCESINEEDEIDLQFNHRYEKTIRVPYLWPNGIEPTSYPPLVHYEETYGTCGDVARGTLYLTNVEPEPREHASYLTYTGILSVIL